MGRYTVTATTDGRTGMAVVLKSVKEISQLLMLSPATINRRFKTSDRIEYNGIIVEKVRNQVVSTAAGDIVTNIHSINDNTIVKIKELGQPEIVPPFTTGGETDKIRQGIKRGVLPRQTLILQGKRLDLLRTIQDMRPSKEHAKTRNYSAVFQIAVDRDGQEVREYKSTKFYQWHRMIHEANEKLKEWETNYDGTKVFSVELHWVDAGELRYQIIYGSTDKEKLLTDYYKYILGTTEGEKTFKKFIKKHKIGAVSTYTQCFIKSFIHSFFNTENDILVTSKYDTLRRHHMKVSEEAKELEYIAKKMSKHYGAQVWIYNKDLELTYKYNEVYAKIVKIMVYGGHAYYILDMNSEDTIKTVKDKFNEQSPITYDEPNESNYNIVYGAYDIETYNTMIKDDEGKDTNKGDTKAFAIGVITELTQYEPFWTKTSGNHLNEDFINYLKCLPQKDGKATKYLLYAHNGGKFDTYNTLYTLLKMNMKITSILCKNGRLIQLSFTGKNNVIIEFRDSMCILAGKLDDLLNDFKCDTKKMTGTVDYDFVNESNHNSLEVINMFVEYLKCDVLGLLELILKVRDIVKEYYQIDLSTCLTNASIARNYFMLKHDFNTTKLYTIPLTTYRKFQDYYLGGRNECFHLGRVNEKLYYYDFTSLYPYEMQKHDLPYGKYESIKLNETTKFNSEWFGMIKVAIKSNSTNWKPYYGIKENGKLMFRHFDEYTTIITTTPHIEYAINNNLDYSYKFIKVWNYKEKSKYFKDIIDGCYKLKIKAEENNNKPLRQMGKIVINSIYGFWGIKFDNIEQIKIGRYTKARRLHKIAKELDREKLKDFKDVGKSTIIYTEDEIDVKCANIGIAMFVTDYARMELYNLMSKVEKAGGKIYYCDTDSIVTNFKLEGTKLGEEFKCKIKGDDMELGDLTNETEERGGGYSEGIFIGCKSYFLRHESETFNNKAKRYMIKDKKYLKSEMKFKGFHVKERYNTKIYDHDNKQIHLTGINRENGKYSVIPHDYKLMCDGYELNTDNFSFITSCKTLDKKSNIIYLKNIKKAKKQYTKAEVLESGECIPFSSYQEKD